MNTASKHSPSLGQHSACVLDIECDSLDPSTIHCVCVSPLDSEDVQVFLSAETLQDYLDGYDYVVAHFGCSFDFPTLRKLWNINIPLERMRDTVILSRLSRPDREGGHSLEAWGKRLGVLKQEFSGDWSALSDEMLEYCKQDVRACKAIYRHLLSEMREFSPSSLEDEHRMQIMANKVSRLGFGFDTAKAEALHKQLFDEQTEISLKLCDVFPPKITTGRTHKRTGKPLKDIVHDFNPASRQQIAERLIELGWKPKRFTDKGQPKVDESTLAECDLPQAAIFARYFLLQKRTAMIKSWISSASRDRVHCTYMTLGAVTNRMSCVDPNLQQVPAVRSPFGKECRELWIASRGKDNVLLDTDAAGLELRVLAHYMDDKKFIDEILNGDVHTANQHMAGLETRDQAKTFIYALCYGAGDAKIGQIVNGSERDGAMLKQRFMANMPAFARLRAAVSRKAAQGYLKAIDGRLIRVRSEHAAMNTLIQGSSAVLMKKWFMYVDYHLVNKRAKAGVVAMVHDELVVESAKESVDLASHCVKMSLSHVNQSYGLKCPLDCDIKIGQNWSEIH